MKLRSCAFVLAPLVLPACMVSGEVARKTAACGDLAVAISTAQRVPIAFGGEEYVFATVTGPDGHLGRYVLDNNGRWTDRLFVSVSTDSKWLRFHLTYDPPVIDRRERRDVNGDGELDFVSLGRGPGEEEYRYSVLAYIGLANRELIHYARQNSTQAEREAGLFTLATRLAVMQELRGQTISWRQCLSNRQDR